MSEWVEGVDVSIYQGRISEPAWRAMRQWGQRVAVVGSWHGLNINPHAELNLLQAKSAGFEIATYIALNGTRSGRQAVQLGKQACGSAWDDLVFVAIDCEIDGITPAIIQAALDECARLGKPAPIYTAYWWWHGHFGNRTDFATVPLWNAYYDQQPDVDFAKLPYGGWTVDDVIGEQYAGSVPYHGTVVDHNTFRASYVLPPPPQEEDEMKPLAFVKLPNQRTYLINFAANTATYVPDGTAIKDARAVGHAEPEPTPTVSKAYLELFTIVE